MHIGLDYWSYAFSNVALLLSCGVAGVVFAFLTASTGRDREPDLTLWYIIPWTVVTWAVVALLPASWIWPRFNDPGFSVNVFQAISESQSFGSYLLRTIALLIVVWGKTTIVWRVRHWRWDALFGLAAIIVLLSILATDYHWRQIEAYCVEKPGQCAVRPPP
ncbi:hypothetical protein [Hansschlegelia plantiphila]|uniref:Uncharacterized protein n=1 Tax=Hansschlegelia plantiphila TaxID=374655 RepID=A0A9W6IXK1_9HYPH|nr:hypothetical protein [Hansschlegelia plantiphila]GLK66991.1 hypothetical protein GCM10008179_06290 [Hansschlegelia plantiphila]